MATTYTLGPNIIQPRLKSQDYDKRTNTFVHPFFGTITGTNTLKDQISNDDVDVSYSDAVPRILGISQEVVRNNKILKALADPAGYLNLKNVDLMRIGDELVPIYKAEYLKQYNLGKSPEEAKNAAIRYVKGLKEAMLAEHEENFPTGLTTQVVGKLQGRNSVGSLPYNVEVRNAAGNAPVELQF